MEKLELKILKAKRTKLLNGVVKTGEKFEEVQDKLNEIELKIKELQNDR